MKEIVSQDKVINHPLRNMYNSLKSSGPCYYGNIGSQYILNTDRVERISCKNWRCFICRKKLKWNLYHNLFYLFKNCNMNRHLVLTFEGSKIRNKVSFLKSYKLLSYEWNKLKRMINYDYGDFNYVCLPRSQLNGYCHYHIILDKYINWNWLDNKRKKYEFLGYCSIMQNKNVADYLHKDFFNDYEYYIPKNVRHYNTSRGIKLIKYNDYKSNIDNVLLMKNKKNKNDFNNILEKMVLEKYGRLLPNYYYIREYYDKMFE